MNNIKLAKTFGLTAALVLGASLSAMASITVNLTFTWSAIFMGKWIYRLRSRQRSHPYLFASIGRRNWHL